MNTCKKLKTDSDFKSKSDNTVRTQPDILYVRTSRCIPKPGISQQKVVEFKGPEQKLATAKLNKAVQAANEPRKAAALKSSMCRRSPSVAEFRRPLVGVNSRPMATQSATNQKKPVKRTGVPLNAVKPKLVKQTPPKARPEPAVKPAPYDYKAKFGLLKETQKILKTNHSSLKEKFTDQSDENDMQEMKGNIRVFCRVRPSLAEEQHRPLYNVDFLDENSIALSKITESMDPSGRLRTTKADFTFDKVFTNMAAQETVFEELAQLNNLVGSIASFLEIYNKNIVDLLCPKNGSHDIRMTDAKGSARSIRFKLRASLMALFMDRLQLYLCYRLIVSAEQVKHFMKLAHQNRAVAAMENNELSSRSHSVAKIQLEAINKARHERCTGSLYLIDLAGAERVPTIGTN
ncbi:non-claret disjunctional [Carabus blaptoides fortunei]